ncbi:MAG: succinate dehydrogenase assembly factor 2 [Alphaproteobacteria bacterium]|nr:succinate dehydrogenase assembly factor 2 [Alphaproteobacteria bacterium]|tara:strand:+ start:21 stop:311 length:291 start_codon:yes stop_codon:yes gene_type:complete
MLKKNNITNLSLRRKKILFKCTHRGTKELDILLGNFVSNHINLLKPKELDYLEVILGFNDIDLYKILTNKKEIDKKMNKLFLKKIIKFNQKFNNYI